MNRLVKFIQGLRYDFALFVFWCLVFTLFRIAFVIIYGNEINDWTQVPAALWLGLRMSFKTSGLICFIGGLLGNRGRILFHSLALVCFSLAFFVRIPYYAVFHASFNHMLINGLYDDKSAILMTALQEYQLIWRLLGALGICALLVMALKGYVSLVRAKLINFSDTKLSWKDYTAVLCLPIMFVFCRYGGAFNYQNSINWESCARLNSNLLNEAILDDGQAFYRVYSMYNRSAKLSKRQWTSAEIKQSIANSGGNANAKTLDVAFKRTVKATALTSAPKNVVVVLGESFGLWPFLPEYDGLHLVEQHKNLLKSNKTSYVQNMLANGDGTIKAINGLLTGLPDDGLQENYLPNSFKYKYKSGIGYIMKQLGYKTVFWYGGYAGWQNVSAIVKAQSFDEFHCADEFQSVEKNSWGCLDEDLFKQITKYMAKQGEEKVFHVVMTTTNHPPYTLDLPKLGFPKEEVRKHLPATIANTEANLQELGHIWYADKTTGEFVKQTEKLIPDSLFILTGDHSERFTFAKSVDYRTMSAIPCIFYGEAAKKLPHRIEAGMQMQLGATLAELLGTQDFTYMSLVTPMQENGETIFNSKYYLDKDAWVKLDGTVKQPPSVGALRDVAAYYILQGEKIKD